MKILVTVASKHGSTREIAEVIADALRAEHVDVDLQQVDDVTTITPYDAVVLGSAIYAGSWLPAATHFAERYRAHLATLPVWVFSSGPLGTEDPQPHDDPNHLAASLGEVAVRDHRIFVGKLDHHELGIAERMIATVVGAPYGDFRDWDAVHGWAREIAAALPAPSVPVRHWHVPVHWEYIDKTFMLSPPAPLRVPPRRAPIHVPAAPPTSLRHPLCRSVPGVPTRRRAPPSAAPPCWRCPISSYALPA